MSDYPEFRGCLKLGSGCGKCVKCVDQLIATGKPSPLRNERYGLIPKGKALIDKEELATLREKSAAFDELSGRRYFKFVHSGHHEYELSFDEEYFYGPSLIGCANQAMKADSDKGVTGE